jgi:hypothetical protein
VRGALPVFSFNHFFSLMLGPATIRRIYLVGGGNVDDASDYSAAVGSKTARHFDCLAARLLRSSRESRLCIGYCVLSDTVMDLFWRDGVERDGRIDFDRLSDDLSMLFQALASIHRATSVLLV